MKKVFILLSLLFHLQLSFADNQDQIDYAFFVNGNDAFITVINDGTKLFRWQNYTVNFLNSYEMPKEKVLLVYADESDNHLIGITANESIVWNLVSGKIEQRQSLTELVNPQALSLSYDEDSDPRENSAYLEEMDLLALSFQGNILVFNPKSGDKKCSAYYEGGITALEFLNTNTLIASERQGYTGLKVFALDVNTSKAQNIITTKSLSSSFAVNQSIEEIAVSDPNSLTTYDSQFNKKSQISKSSYTIDKSLTYINKSVVGAGNTAGMTYYFRNGGFSKSFFFNFSTQGNYEIEQDQILTWNNSMIYIVNTIGEQLLRYDFSNTTFLVNEQKQSISDLSITNTYTKGTRSFSTDKNGNLLIYNNNDLVDSLTILSTAISHLNFVREDLLFIAGLGRGSIYDLKKKDHKQVLNGHSGLICTSTLFDEDFYLTAGLDNKLILWDVQTGIYIDDFEIENTPLKFEQIEGLKVTIRLSNGEEQVVNLENAITSFLNPERRFILSTGHNGSINSLEFSTDGNKMLSTDNQGYLKIWDVKTMTPLQTIVLDEAYLDACFVNDDREIVAFSTNSIYQIDAYSGKIKRHVQVPPMYSQGSLAFHQIKNLPNRPYVFINNNRNNSQFIYHTASGLFYQLMSTGHKYQPYNMDYDEVHNRIATFSSDNIEIWSFGDKIERIQKISNTNNSSENMYVTYPLAFSPNGERILFYRDDQIVIYDLEQERELLAVRTMKASFTSNDELVFYDFKKWVKGYNIVKININTQDTLFNLYRDEWSGVSNITYNKALNAIALGSSSGNIELINADNGSSLKQTRSENRSPKAYFNPNNGKIATSTWGKVLFFDWQNLKHSAKPINYSTNFGKVSPNFSYSPKGKYLVIRYGNLTRFYDPHYHELLFEINKPIDNNYQITENDQFLAFATFDSVYVYNIPKQALEVAFAVEKDHLILDFQAFSNDSEAGIFLVHRVLNKGVPKKDLYQDADFQHYFSSYDILNKKWLAEPVPWLTPLKSIEKSKSNQYLVFDGGWKTVTIVDIVNGTSENYFLDINNSIEWLKITPDDKDVILADDEGWLYFIDIKTGKIKEQLKAGETEVRNVDFYQGKYMLSSSFDGGTSVWSYPDKQLLTSLRVISDDEYIFTNEEGYYAGTPGIAEAVFFLENNKVYQFDQFDLIYNRPDLVIKKVNPNSSIQEAYQKAYEKRIQKLGFTHVEALDDQSVPSITAIERIENIQSAEETYTFTLMAEDEKTKIERIHININGVPQFGVKGFILDKPSKFINEQISAVLSKGENQISVSVVNNAGIESLKETFYITYTGEAKEPKIYYIGIGVDQYQDENHVLKYASKDIHDLNEVFANQYPDIIPINLTDTNVTRENILALKENLLQTSVNDLVIVSFSGHGVLDDKYNWYYAPYDMDFGNPSAHGMTYDDIEWLLDSIPARKKLLMIDACHSGEVDDELVALNNEISNDQINSLPGTKGASVVNTEPVIGIENSFQLMQELFANLSRGNGAVVISAAGGMEYAYEGTDWNNGVFTYCVRKGLQDREADLNKDRVITVSELKSYVSSEVEKKTNGMQKPTSRQENLENDFVIW